MTLPTNFEKNPSEEPRHFFRNVCIEFKKTVLSKDYKRLEIDIENFINASKQMNWHIKTSDVFRKDVGEKSVQHVLSTCDRYYKALIADPKTATYHDLLEALEQLEKLIDAYKAS